MASRIYTLLQVSIPILEDHLKVLLLQSLQVSFRCLLQLLCWLESDSPEARFHARKEKEITKGQVRAVGWVLYYFHSPAGHPGGHQRWPVSWGIVLETPLSTAVSYSSSSFPWTFSELKGNTPYWWIDPQEPIQREWAPGSRKKGMTMAFSWDLLIFALLGWEEDVCFHWALWHLLSVS